MIQRTSVVVLTGQTLLPTADDRGPPVRSSVSPLH